MVTGSSGCGSIMISIPTSSFAWIDFGSIGRMPCCQCVVSARGEASVTRPFDQMILGQMAKDFMIPLRLVLKCDFE